MNEIRLVHDTAVNVDQMYRILMSRLMRYEAHIGFLVAVLEAGFADSDAAQMLLRLTA